MRVVLAALGFDALATGGVTAMLGIIMTAMLRRTKDTDDRRDEVTEMVVSTAAEREARAWSERDKAIREGDEARAEVERLRKLLEDDDPPAPQRARKPRSDR